MATFRDDLGKLGRRLLETVEERTDRKVVPSQLLESLESGANEARMLRRELRAIGWELLNYQPGDPTAPGGYELTPQARWMAYREALVAWIEDPLAGQQVDLYVSFVLGRGVPRPQAHDPEVQDALDDAWDDPSNQRVLTKFDKLVEKAIDLCLQSNVYFTFFDDGEDGMVRVSLLRFDDVIDVIRHDEVAADGKADRLRILYYKAFERRIKYDFTSDTRGLPIDSPQPDQISRTVYYEAWGAFDPDDPVMAIQDEGLTRPPVDKVRPGKVVHLAVNKTSEMAFGVPRMRRLIRWFSAYNETLESHVKRMKAMASIYMKATVHGSQRDLDRMGQQALGRASMFDGARDLDTDPDRPVGPRSPGIIGQNESLNYEPFKIDSGAGDMQASAPIIRGQAGGPWPDNYMSGHAQGSLAGATAMELPVLKFVEREQEVWLTLFRAFCDAQIAARIDVGDLTEWRDATDNELQHMQDAEQAGEESPYELNDQGQVLRDLGYDISLPSPLKRAMNDLVGAAVQVATAVDPNGANPELSRWLLGFILAEAFDVEDPQRIVDQVLPRQFPPADAVPPGAAVDPTTGQPLDPAAAAAAAAAGNGGAQGAAGADGQQHPATTPYGAPRQSPPADQRPIKEAALDRTIDQTFADLLQVADQQLQALADLPAASTNGHHPGA